MNLKISVEKPSFHRAPRRIARESKAVGYAPAAPKAPSPTNYGTCKIAEVPKRRKTRRTPAPATPQRVFAQPGFTLEPQAGFRVGPLPGLLSRAFSWLRSASVAPKQLRVEDTVSLGEKRFVAIVHAEGRRFLIGGGSAGVSLLKQLDENPESEQKH
jgi:hypothetical protein